jgi:tRNA uridine 5-carboxymethylaminomethyl modification enzyme
MPASRALRQPDTSLQALVNTCALPLEIAEPRLDVPSIETEFRYEGYLRRQEQTIARVRRQEERPIPADFPYARIAGLSREMVERLGTVRPETIGQASRVPGVTPAAVALIAAHVAGRIEVR